MKVNRVFCYSKNVANENGNQLPILKLISVAIMLIVGPIMVSFLENSFLLFAMVMMLFTVLLIYYSMILGIRLRSRLSGWALTNDGRIFKAVAINNGQGLYFGGIAAGSLVDQLVGNDSHIGGNIGGVVGATTQFYAMNKSAQYMSHPEIIAKMVEEAPNITGAEVYEILKVYRTTDRKHSVKINCDYKIIRTGKIKYNKNLVIEKSYNQFQDLISCMNTHR